MACIFPGAVLSRYGHSPRQAGVMGVMSNFLIEAMEQMFL